LSQTKLDLADIFREHGHQLGPLWGLQKKVVRAITRCRTALLGGHIYECNSCGLIDQSYNSCRNRHCIKCQFAAKRHWIEDRASELLPVPYYHVVFTLPHEFNQLVLGNKREIYDILFKASSEAVKEVFRERYKADPGMIAVLHTWGQNLSLHPHIHMIIPGGGLSAGNADWVRCSKDFFVNVRAMSLVFRAKFVKMIRKLYRSKRLTFCDSNRHLENPNFFQDMIDTTFKQHWNVYAKKPFRNPIHVLKYLGGYTHRIAFANHRLLDFDEHQVQFKVRNNQAQKSGEASSQTMSLPTAEFMRRFLMHILPSGFVRIRHFGFLASARKKKAIETARTFIAARVFRSAATVADLVKEFSSSSAITSDTCPSCKLGQLIKLETLVPRMRENSS
jgi:Putative transposase/Transposase zinc-binding domain